MCGGTIIHKTRLAHKDTNIKYTIIKMTSSSLKVYVPQMSVTPGRAGKNPPLGEGVVFPYVLFHV